MRDCLATGQQLCASGFLTCLHSIAVVFLKKDDQMSNQMSELATEGEYRRSERRNVNMALTLLFVGVALGALAALLLAPKTGKQMRRTLRRKYEGARQAVEDFGDQASDLVDKGSEWADQAKSKGGRLGKLFQR